MLCRWGVRVGDAVPGSLTSSILGAMPGPGPESVRFVPRGSESDSREDIGVTDLPLAELDRARVEVRLRRRRVSSPDADVVFAELIWLSDRVDIHSSSFGAGMMTIRPGDALLDEGFRSASVTVIGSGGRPRWE